MPKVCHSPFAEITEALLRSGYTSLDAQAQALGISRSTVWTIITGKHKRGRLHANTTIKILSNPALPAQVRAVMEAYAASVGLDAAHRSTRRLKEVANGSAPD